MQAIAAGCRSDTQPVLPLPKSSLSALYRSFVCCPFCIFSRISYSNQSASPRCTTITKLQLSSSKLLVLPAAQLLRGCSLGPAAAAPAAAPACRFAVSPLLRPVCVAASGAAVPAAAQGRVPGVAIRVAATRSTKCPAQLLLSKAARANSAPKAASSKASLAPHSKSPQRPGLLMHKAAHQIERQAAHCLSSMPLVPQWAHFINGTSVLTTLGGTAGDGCSRRSCHRRAPAAS